MADEILPFPKIPENLLLAATQGSLVPFVGAGVSKLGGCPNWEEFADGALAFFVDSGKISCAQKDQMSKLPPRVKLSVALGLEREHSVLIDFAALLRPGTSTREIEDGNRVYAGLAKLAKTFVTTNYDPWLDTDPAAALPGGSPAPRASDSLTPKRRVVYEFDKIDSQTLSEPNTVIHLHGSALDARTMVMTTPHYLDRYRSHKLQGDGRENSFLTFLETLFKTKSVLFVGYSLSELEILEYVVQKARQVKPTTGEAPRHYILQGFYSHEVELKRALEQYYLNDCGIGLLAFSRDAQDWRQLVEVIERFALLMPAADLLPIRARDDMRALLGG